LRQNLVHLSFPFALHFLNLRKISAALRGGNLRILSLGVLWTGALDTDDVKALFNKADFPCLESFEIPPREENSEEDPDDSEENPEEDFDEDPEWGEAFGRALERAIT
jgi:hypothetical protein